MDWLAVVVNHDLSIRVRPYLQASRVGPLCPGLFFFCGLSALEVCGEQWVCGSSGAECQTCDRSTLTDTVRCSFLCARLPRPAQYRAERISRFVYIPLLPSQQQNTNKKLKPSEFDLENTSVTSQEPFITKKTYYAFPGGGKKQRDETQDGCLEQPAIHIMEREQKVSWCNREVRDGKLQQMHS